MNTPTFIKALPVWAEQLKDEMNVTLVFKSDFLLAEGEVPVLRMTGAQAYRITFNGEYAGYGPARAPKGFARIDEWALAPFAKVGANSLAIEVVQYRINNYYLPNVPGFLQAEVVCGDRVVASTPDGFTATLSPRIKETSRFSFQRNFTEVWPVSKEEKAGEAFELSLSEYGKSVTLLPRRVEYPTFEFTEPFKAIAGVSFYFDPESKAHPYWWREVENRPSFAFSACDVKEDVSLERLAMRLRSLGDVPAKEVLAPEGGVLYKCTSLMTGFFALDVEVTSAPCRVVVTFDEILDENTGYFNLAGREESANIVVWEFDAPGKYHVESFEPYALQYVHAFTTEGEAVLEALRLRTYQCPNAVRKTPDFSDPVLTEIYESARRTFEQNAVDVFTDCPGRERAGWLCDSFFTGRVSRFFTGKNDLEELFLENFAVPEAFEDIPKGMVPMCWPADHPGGAYIPNWSMWLVLELEEYYRVRGGKAEFVEKFRPRVMELVEFFKGFENEDGLLENLQSWVFVEWSKANSLTGGVNYPSNMLWAETLDAIARLYNEKSFAEKAAAMRETIRRQSFDGRFFRDHALRDANGKLVVHDDTTETCQYYAFFTHVATVEGDPKMWDMLLKDFGPQRAETGRYPNIYPSNAFIGNYLRVELLARQQLNEQIIRELRGFFKYMSDRTGTLWEHTSATASCCHGFASHVAIFLENAASGTI